MRALTHRHRHKLEHGADTLRVSCPPAVVRACMCESERGAREEERGLCASCDLPCDRLLPTWAYPTIDTDMRSCEVCRTFAFNRPLLYVSADDEVGHVVVGGGWAIHAAAEYHE